MPPVIVPTEFAVAILFTPEGEVAMQRRSEDSAVYAGMLSLFGGRLEENESPRRAINRELREELNISGGRACLRMYNSVAFGAVPEFPWPSVTHIFSGYLPPDYTLLGDNGAVERYPLSIALVQADLTPATAAALEAEYYRQKDTHIRGD